MSPISRIIGFPGVWRCCLVLLVWMAANVGLAAQAAGGDGRDCASADPRFADLDAKVKALKAELYVADKSVRKGLPTGTRSIGRVVRGPDGKLKAACPGQSAGNRREGRTLTVGPGEEFRTLGDAVGASFAGDVVVLRGGVYKNQSAFIRHPLTIRSYPGERAIIRGTQKIPNRRGFLVARADLTLEGVVLSGATVPARNGAGIRWESGDLTIRDTDFIDNENGILGNSNHRNGTLLIERSRFIGNGSCDGPGCAHGIYISGQTVRVVIRDSEFRNTNRGNHIQSRAQETHVINSTFDDGDSPTSYSISLNDGGVGIISGNTIVQGPNAENEHSIRLGDEGYLLVEGNRFVNRAPAAIGILNQGSLDAIVRGNSFQGYTYAGVARPGAFVLQGNTFDGERSDDAGRWILVPQASN